MANTGTDSAKPYPTFLKLSRDQCSIQSGKPADTDLTKDDFFDDLPTLLSSLEEEKKTLVTWIGIR